MTTRQEIEKLPFAEILSLARKAYEDEEDQSDIYSDCVWTLARRGDRETLNQLWPLTTGDVFERDFSVSSLGPFDCDVPYNEEGKRGRRASQEIINLLLEMLETETNEEVLAEIVSSLGQHQEVDERTPLALERFVDHPNADIRWRLALGLGNYDSPESIAMLLQLSTDAETRVRDWATFQLGTALQTDSPPIRSALWARVDDEDPDTRVEAIVGLAVRRDPKILPVIRKEFDDDLTPEQPYIPNNNLMEALQEWDDATGDEEVKETIAWCAEVIENFSD